MADLLLETPERRPAPGDLLEYWQERTVPIGTWHLDLEEEMDELGAAMREELGKRGIQVGYNSYLSRHESTAFTYRLTVALRVHEINLPTEPEDKVQLAAFPVWAAFRIAAAVVIVLGVGWIASEGVDFVSELGDLAVEAPDAFADLSETVQVVAIALALIAFVFLLNKVLR